MDRSVYINIYIRVCVCIYMYAFFIFLYIYMKMKGNGRLMRVDGTVLKTLRIIRHSALSVYSHCIRICSYCVKEGTMGKSYHGTAYSLGCTQWE